MFTPKYTALTIFKLSVVEEAKWMEMINLNVLEGNEYTWYIFSYFYQG